MRKIYIFRAGAPDKVQFGTPEGGMILVDQANEKDFDWEATKEDVKVIVNEAFYEMMFAHGITQDKFDEYHIVAPRQREHLWKTSMTLMDKNFIVPSTVEDGETIKEIYPNWKCSKIIKPTKGSGCRGIIIYPISEEDRKKIEKMPIPNVIVSTKIESLIVDEDTYMIQDLNMNLLTDTQFSVNICIKDGKMVDYCIHEKAGTELFSRWVTAYINHKEEVVKAVEMTIENMIKSLGIESGLTDFECFYYPNNPIGEQIKIFEINSRWCNEMSIIKGLEGVDFGTPFIEMQGFGHKDYEWNQKKFCDIVRGKRYQYKIGEAYYKTDDLNWFVS